MSAITEAHRLYCDAMLASLARWLRAAGYDTGLAPASATDRAVPDACRAQQRVLVTRDRHLAAHAGADVRVSLLVANSLDAQASELSGERPIRDAAVLPGRAVQRPAAGPHLRQ